MYWVKTGKGPKTAVLNKLAIKDSLMTYLSIKFLLQHAKSLPFPSC